MPATKSREKVSAPSQKLLGLIRAKKTKEKDVDFIRDMVSCQKLLSPIAESFVRELESTYR